MYDGKPTPEFLKELRVRAARYGWNGDWREIFNFVRALHVEAGLPLPDGFHLGDPEEYVEIGAASPSL